jgi:hypothetical protein
MTIYVDIPEHFVDVVVAEWDFADLRGLSSRKEPNALLNLHIPQSGIDWSNTSRESLIRIMNLTI